MALYIFIMALFNSTPDLDDSYYFNHTLFSGITVPDDDDDTRVIHCNNINIILH